MIAERSGYDHIVIGAGSAGCVLASLLSREPSRRVLLLEAGGEDRNPMIHIPGGFTRMMKDPKLNWCFTTEPEAELSQRRIDFPRGKVLGGSSSINGMVYIRGHRLDYEDWAAKGCPGWSWDEVLPWFRRTEHNVNGADTFHGVGGPLWVDNPVNRYPVDEVFIEAGASLGWPRNADFNCGDNEGVGYYQTNIRRGRRQSLSVSALAPVRKRPNLSVAVGALALGLELEGGRASGVRYRQGKEVYLARAESEVVICAGTIGSPQLLELSGIGDPQVLCAAGIEPRHELPGVGAGMQDHLTVNMYQGLSGIGTLYEEMRPLAFARNLLNYFFRQRGFLVHPAAESGAFFKSDAGLDRPDAQIHFTPATGRYNAKGNLEITPGVTATVCHLHPQSRGTVHIRTTNPEVAPVIRANYLSTEADCKALIMACRQVRALFAAPPFARYHRAESGIAMPVDDSDQAILDYIRREANSVYHPVGSCEMGAENESHAVVDPQLRVRGLSGLRIADASVIPLAITGNTNALAVMIGARAAHMLADTSSASATH